MCGLIYNHNFEGAPVNQAILSQYFKQASRGKEGFGIFDGQELNMVHTSKERKFLSWLRRYNSHLIMAHHRFPTSTKNVDRACHPFTTRRHFGDNQYVLIHNGWLTNEDTLKAAHEAEGIEYQSLLADGSYNDSEALLWDFARYMEGKQDSLQAQGAIAFICMQTYKGKLKTLHFGRNDANPLHLQYDDDGLRLSSEGAGENIPTNLLFSFDYGTNELQARPLTIPRQAYRSTTSYGYGGNYYGNYTASSYDQWEDEEDLRQWNRSFGLEDDLADEARATNAELEDMPQYQALDNQQAVMQAVMDYLKLADGHFESAYWAMETDLMDLEEDAVTLPENATLKYEYGILQLAQEVLGHDLEYIDRHSYSSMMKATV